MAGRRLACLEYKALAHKQSAYSTLKAMPTIQTISAIILLYVAASKDFVASFQTTTISQHTYNVRWATAANEAMRSSSEEESDAVRPIQLPNFSPVSWLRQEAWASMSRYEKESFLEHVTKGFFQSERLDVHDRYYATPDRFNTDDIDFGKGVDRVVLGRGPRRVLVLAGIHGNEPCGVEAVKMMLQRKSLFSGNNANVTSEELLQDENWTIKLDTLFDSLTIEFLLGNPAALSQNSRFIKRNLNRLFDINTLCDSELAEQGEYRYELHRARLITESIRHADFVLDIHSCSSDVGSFALPSSLDLSECLAEHLPVKYVVESLVHSCLDGGTTLDAALWNDVPGVCVECGQHTHKDVGKCTKPSFSDEYSPSPQFLTLVFSTYLYDAKVSRAAAVISSFLRLQVLQEDGAFATPSSKSSERPITMICTYAERVSHGFEWLKKFPEFHFVAEDEPVFRDADRGVVKCPKGGAFIVMPTAQPVLGEEALFWAFAK
jgi:hypothetical protein